MKRRQFLLSAASAAVVTTAVRAQGASFSDGVVRIGVLNDRSGPYADLSGTGSEIAARMAAEQFGNNVHGTPVDIVAADHQNLPDVGVTIARKWYDVGGVDVIVDIANSSVSIAINGLVKDRKKLVLHNSASADLTGKFCEPRSIQWQYSAYASAHNVVTKQMVDGGMNSFFIIAVDYALGKSISDTFKSAVRQLGGRVVGEVRHPVNASDFASYLLQAQASGAKAVMLANAGSDLANSLKQAREFGLTPSVQLLSAALTSDVIRSVGLEVIQGLQVATWYNIYRDEVSRAWAEAFSRRYGKLPTELQASTYSAVLNYLKAIDVLATDDADKVIAKLKEMTIKDEYVTNGHIRPDGVMAHDMYLARLKAPNESAGPGDYYNVLKVIPGDQANVPLAQTECPYVKA